MKKIICFCLWGDNPFYTYGAIENVLNAKKYFPDFKCRFYVSTEVPDNIKDFLKKETEYFEIENKRQNGYMCKRFLPFFDKDVDIFLSRDADSRLTERESKIINDWINEKTGFLSLFESGGRGDDIKIDGGMFACNNTFFRKEFDEIKDKSLKFFEKAKHRGIDRYFLNEFIYPIVKNSFSAYANFKIYGGYHLTDKVPMFLKDNIVVKEIPYDIKLDLGTRPINRCESIGDRCYNVSEACKYLNIPIIVCRRK